MTSNKNFIRYSARKARFKLKRDVEVPVGAPLDSVFEDSVDFTGFVKNLTLMVPEGNVSKEDFTGEDADGYQYQRYNEDSFGDASVEGTLLVEDKAYLEPFAYGEPVSIGATHVRYKVGAGGRPKDAAMLFRLDNGVDACNFLLNCLIFEKVGDIKMTGTDGHWEMDFRAKTLVKDFHGPEYLIDDSE
jgi:hypothetical protein